MICYNNTILIKLLKGGNNMKTFNGYEVDECGRIVDTIKSNGDCQHINCMETTGHPANIVTLRKDDVEITYYKDQGRYGSEVYFFKQGTWDIKYSRNYPNLNGLPKKYDDTVIELSNLHRKIFTKA
jgi:hypothetical protein